MMAISGGWYVVGPLFYGIVGLGQLCGGIWWYEYLFVHILHRDSLQSTYSLYIFAWCSSEMIHLPQMTSRDGTRGPFKSSKVQVSPTFVHLRIGKPLYSLVPLHGWADSGGLLEIGLPSYHIFYQYLFVPSKVLLSHFKSLAMWSK